MGKLISAWTEQHVPIALALVVAGLGGAVAAAEPPPSSLIGIGAVLVTVLGALFVDAFGGLVLGVAAAAGVAFGEQLQGTWTPETFVRSLSLAVALVVLGWLVGMVSSGLHGARRSERGPDAALSPAYGSLGLLTADVALARLDEEVARARRHRRPLTVVAIRVTVTEEDLDPRARDAAFRAVARLVETLLRETDVPFALEPGEFGAVLPETDVATAWDVLGPVLDAASRAAFTVREEDERRSLEDSAELHAGLATLDDGPADADELLESARRAARADERAAQVDGPHRPGTAA